MKIKQKKNLNILTLIKIKPYKKKINEKYMNLKQIKHFKKILFLIYTKLVLNIKKNKILIKNNKKKINFPKFINKLIQEEKFTINLHNKYKKKKLINKIINSIKKIKKGNFGYCEHCNNKIGIKILESKPTENLCINCKILYNIKYK